MVLSKSCTLSLNLCNKTKVDLFLKSCYNPFIRSRGIEMRQPRKRNPIAKALRTPLFRKRTVESRVVYNRKKTKEITNEQ